jgi:hypothetical protein
MNWPWLGAWQVLISCFLVVEGGGVDWLLNVSVNQLITSYVANCTVTLVVIFAFEKKCFVYMNVLIYFFFPKNTGKDNPGQR